MRIKFLIFAALPLLLLAACGKKDDTQTVVQGSYINGQYVPAGGVATPQILGQYPYFYVNYRVTEAHCDGGLRRFSGNSYLYVKSIMCSSFLNESMNQNCGRAQRMAMYESICR